MPLETVDIIACIVGSVISEAVRKVDPKEGVTVRSRVVNIAAGLAAGAYIPQPIWTYYPHLRQWQEATIFACAFCGSSFLHYMSGVVNNPGEWKKLPIINRYFPKDEEGTK